ncbi:hypothetical protein AOLE_00400 [Acinetobacter oleivorans DR1]|uniref:Uncharacterized protein n=1 Tax=Acinetobacter oleivorans (strain JCM 16667 / KCTC 23045 / DR1) TaxID=436717 RepID=A0AAN0UBH2_ACISD|nr:hypothetical protein AOLE_00400 [Acinetobacter oleivorans DR1]ESK42407.1 hypothetical protein P254_03238 [Acinetobacter oleivorans CIP 110421]
MKLHKFILFLNLVVGAYGITNDDANAQQEFKRICLSGEHMQASCECICQQLEQVYSPQTVQRLKRTSLQSPVLPQDFAPNFFSSIQRCEKNSNGLSSLSSFISVSQ